MKRTVNFKASNTYRMNKLNPTILIKNILRFSYRILQIGEVYTFLIKTRRLQVI